MVLVDCVQIHAPERSSSRLISDTSVWPEKLCRKMLSKAALGKHQKISTPKSSRPHVQKARLSLYETSGNTSHPISSQRRTSNPVQQRSIVGYFQLWVRSLEDMWFSWNVPSHRVLKRRFDPSEIWQTRNFAYPRRHTSCRRVIKDNEMLIFKTFPS